MMGKTTMLWEHMRLFKAHEFVALEKLLTMLHEFGQGYEELLTSEKRAQVIDLQERLREEYKKAISLIRLECKALGFKASAKTVDRMQQILDDPSKNLPDWVTVCEELSGRIRDEMEMTHFLSVREDEWQYLTESEPFGKQVATAFPSAIFDLQEAAKCRAFERWTAVVFHLSRVAEIAMVSIGERVGYKSPKPGFGEVLKYMDNQLKKAREDHSNANPLFRGDLEFLSGVTAQMHAVNQAWRAKVSHLDKKYPEEEALRIWDATKGLMQNLSTKLKEEV